ncbi:MAG: cell cycle transcriptional regulator TrcR [Rickettsiaceae bacterium]
MTKNKKLPLMPKATAVWLIDNTTLTFKQIADFCGIHELEVKGIADGEVAVGVIADNPITSGQIEKAEIERCSKDPNAKLQLKTSVAYEVVSKKKKKGAKYTPIARRQDKPDAIFWLIKNFPEVKDSTIKKLIGTTKSTVDAVRNRTHWNMANIRQRDPVLLGICSQTDLDKVVEATKLEANNNGDSKTSESGLDK